MDPVSIFEDALKGLATKDSDDKLEPPRSTIQSVIPESTKTENSTTPQKRSPLVTTSLLVNSPAHAQPPTKVAEDTGGDIILNALINAGITPSSLNAPTDTSPAPIKHVQKPLSTAVKVVSAKGPTVYKIVRNPISAANTLSPSQHPLGIANSVVGPFKLDRENFVTSSIRKRPAADILTRPDAKIWRPANGLPFIDPTAARHQSVMLSSTPSVPSRLNGWAGHIKTQRFGGPTNFLGSPMNFVKPYQFLKRDEDMDDDEGLTQAETYADYVPLKLRIGHRHPDPVVESSSLSSVSPPDIHYQHCLPNETIEMGCLSSLQLEAVIYACQRHECILPNGQRAGFLIGDGAGVGKGRTIAGIIYENYLRHRKKAIWLSVSNDLKVDAERDLRDVGLFKVNVHSLSKFKYARISGKENGRVKKGIIFSTYSSLIGESQGGAKAKYKTRLKQLVHWCGKNFDGVIVFDECHRAKNLTPSGSQKPTKTGLTVLELQNRLPHARIVYASATGATEPRNMGYMTRLGLWGEGTPFKTFNSFIQTLERRGVGAMELVAMDMKLRGMYIARQLSFKGVHFGIREVSIEDVKLKNENFIDVYNQCTDLWVYAYRFFSEATRLLCPGDRYRKTMWGQFWSSHQRFFKYLCIAAKLDACVELTKAALKDGHCVVIGLQSTGEAKTLEQVEEFGCDLGDFVSTTKGVFQSLIEKYFPTTSNLEAFSQRGDRLASAGDRTSSLTLSRAGRAIAAGQGSGLGLKDVLGEKMFARLVAGGSLSGSTDADAYTDSKLSKGLTDSDDGGDGPSEDSEDEESDSESKANEKERSTSSDYYDSDLELNSASNSARKRRQKKKTPANRAQTSTSRRKQQQQQANSSSDEFLSNSDDDWDPDAMFDSFLARQNMWTRENSELRKKAGTTSLLDNFSNEDSTRELSQKYLLRRNCLKDASSVSQASVSPDEAKRQCHEMQTLLLKFIEKLGSKLPPSSLDELIDKLGGPSCVAEMTGRKGRMVMNGDGRVTYESRREFDVNLEILNLTEKQRFMDGDKLIAIISEAASSGISLQADRRASNQRRRVHITLELPWSADRAIQQFGRTHRSNQVSAPKYVFLISDLAGEQRFASTVAKRLESLGALTHGDRRATDTRDLSQFNIDNKLGREALDIVMRSCTTGDEGIVDPPMDYTSTEMDDEEKSSVVDKAHRFFVDVKASLQGVGLATGHARDRESNQMSKFLNRILGMRVHVQNALFRYFSDTLEELIRRAKRDNRLDLGIMDLGTSGQNVDITWTKSFDTWFLSESTKVHLHKITSERGLSWASAMEIYSQHDGSNDGFYLPSNVSSGRLVLPILAVYVKSRPAARLSGGKVDTKYYRIYRPNTGMQARPLELEKLKERYTRVSNPSDCQDAWQRVFKDSATRCSHVMQHGVCPRAVNNRVVCEVGLRVRTYYVLSGSVLNVWAQIEPLLQSQSNGSRCMQVVRLRSKDGQRIIGSLIPQECVEGILNCLSNPVETSTSAGAIPSTFTGRIGYVPHVGRLAHPKSEAVLSSADRQWPRRTPDSNAFNTNPSSPRRFSHYSRSPRVQSFHRPFSQRPSILQRSTTPGNRNLSSPFSSPIRSTLPRSASFSSVGMFLPSADPAKSDSTDFGLPQNRFGSRLNAALSSNGTPSFSSPLSQVRESVLSSTKSFLNASSSVMSTSSNAATSSTTAPSVSKKQPVKATKFKIRWKEG